MPITNNHVPTMQIDIPERIFVAHDSESCDNICATTTMDDCIRRIMNFMYAHDFICANFHYDETYTVIEYTEMIRVGAAVSERHGTITIMETKLFKSDE